MHWAAWVRLTRLALVRLETTISIYVDDWFLVRSYRGHFRPFTRVMHRFSTREYLSRNIRNTYIRCVYSLYLYIRARHNRDDSLLIKNNAVGPFFSQINKRSSRSLVFVSRPIEPQSYRWRRTTIVVRAYQLLLVGGRLISLCSDGTTLRARKPSISWTRIISVSWSIVRYAFSIRDNSLADYIHLETLLRVAEDFLVVESFCINTEEWYSFFFEERLYLFRWGKLILTVC